MEKINTEYLDRCIQTLEKSYIHLNNVEDIDSIEFELYRNSLVKGFELCIEQSGKLLRKRLAPYFSSKRELDRVYYKDLYRYALKFSLLDDDEVRRWFKYRDNRNTVSHDYGQDFATETLNLIDDFLLDVKKLSKMIANE